MYLRQLKRNGRVYLSIVKGYRDKDGKPKSKTIESLGYLDELVSKFDDPIAHFKQICKERTVEEQEENKLFSVTFYPKQKIDKRKIQTIALGAAIPSKYFHYDLGITKYFDNRKSNRKFKADPARILELLVWNRLTNPGSKRKAFELKDEFPRKCNFSIDDVYRCLTYLNKNSSQLLDFMNKTYEEKRGKRNLSNLYYDVTNYYFEIEQEDGFKMRGVSKEHRPNPIVQMGMMLDSDFIPYNYEIFSGNTSDCLTLLPIMKKCGLRKGKDRVVVVADKGINTSDNIAACILDNNGYIFSQSVRKATKQLKNWVLDENGYNTNKEKTFKIKSRQSVKKIYVKDLEGKTKIVEVPVKEIAFWSKNYFDRSRHEREKVVEKSRNAISNASICAAKAHSSVKYVKDLPYVKSTGEKASHNWVINESKIKTDEELDGYYCIITSEVNMPDNKIIEAYRGLTKIEESFRVLKGDLSARPVYVSREDHIRAHFLICYIAFFIMRLMQKDSNWKYSATKIADTLNNMKCHRMDMNHFLCNYRSDVAEDIAKSVKQELFFSTITKKGIAEAMSKAKNFEKWV